MAEALAPGLWERLLGDYDGGRPWTLQDYKDSIARSLEDLLNTRQAIPDDLIEKFPNARRSILTYGLNDFSALCISSDKDRRWICSAVTLAILRHEPRLTDVRARLHPESTSINRLGFIIKARLKGLDEGSTVQFDGILEPSAQRCTIRTIGA